MTDTERIAALEAALASEKREREALAATVGVLQARAERDQREHISIIERAVKPIVTREDFELTMASVDARLAELASATTPEAMVLMLPQIVQAIGAMLTTLKMLMEQVPAQGQHLLDAYRAIVDMRQRLDAIEAGLISLGWVRVAVGA